MRGRLRSTLPLGLGLALLFTGALLLDLVPAVAAGPRGNGSPIAFTLTAQNTSDRLTPQTPLSWIPHKQRRRKRRGSASGATATVLTVDLNQTYQTIEGFGGEFNEAAHRFLAAG